MTKRRCLMIGVILCLIAIISAGCETMNPEWSGNMQNEHGPHVQPQNLDAPRENNSDAIKIQRLMKSLDEGAPPASRAEAAGRP